jgi:hypothetical protein
MWVSCRASGDRVFGSKIFLVSYFNFGRPATSYQGIYAEAGNLLNKAFRNAVNAFSRMTAGRYIMPAA